MKNINIKIIVVIILFCVLLWIFGCTRSDVVQLTSLGAPGEITCYSGGQVIYHGKSTGKISTEDRSDGWYFEDATTLRLVRVSGACVIRN